MKRIITSVTLILLFSVSSSAQIQYMTPWWTATGTSDTCALGLSVAGIGDVNQDGYDDFAACTYDEQVWIFLGSPEPDSIPDMFLNSPDATVSYFGWRVHNIGDVDGDTYIDLAVQAQTQNFLRKLFIYFAGANFDTIPDLIVGPPEINEVSVVVGIADFNGDGDDDFALTDKDYVPIPGQPYEGRLQVFYGGEALDSLPDWEITAGPERDRFPQYCVGLGDLNGDGCAELAASSPMCTGPNGEDDMGLVEVYYGGSPPDTTPDFRLYGSETDEGLGSNLTALDVNCDNHLEMGAFSSRDFPPDYTRSILLYNMIPEPDSIPDYFIGGNDNYKLGSRPTVIDFNGDGADDLATGGGGPGFGTGAVHIYLGGETFDESIDCIMNGQHMDERLGQGIANIGDINGDGIEDLAAGAPGYDGGIPGFYGTGRVHTILGDTTYHQSVGIPRGTVPEQPEEFTLSLHAFPNPFNASTVLSFQLQVAGFIKLDIFNISGRNVGAGSPHPYNVGFGESDLHWYPPGTHQISFEGSGLASGIYLVRFRTADQQVTKKIVLLR